MPCAVQLGSQTLARGNGVAPSTSFPPTRRFAGQTTTPGHPEYLELWESTDGANWSAGKTPLAHCISRRHWPTACQDAVDPLHFILIFAYIFFSLGTFSHRRVLIEHTNSVHWCARF